MATETPTLLPPPAAPPRRPPIFNLPNQLTASRFVLAIVLFWLISLQEWTWCTIVFAIAAFTDWLDGYLARKLNLGSTLGRNLDPLVDKILTCGAFIYLIPFPQAGVATWMVTLIVTRELLVTSLRSFIENRGGSFGAAWPGKLKMILQCGALLAIFFHEAVRPHVSWHDGAALLRDTLIYAMIVVTLLSGLQYLWRAVILLREE